MKKASVVAAIKVAKAAGSKRKRADSSASVVVAATAKKSASDALATKRPRKPTAAAAAAAVSAPTVKEVEGVGDVLYNVADRSQWRTWLEKNASSTRRIHVHLPKKETSLPSLPYDVAVEEAMCFGWIDSTVRPVDNRTATAQQYTPRRKGSSYSQLNLERARWLLKEKMIPDAALREELAAEVAKNDKEAKPARKPIDAAIKKQGGTVAWKHWQSFPEPYRRVRAAYILIRDAGSDDYVARLANLIKNTEKGKQYGSSLEKYTPSASPPSK